MNDFLKEFKEDLPEWWTKKFIVNDINKFTLK